MPFLPDGYLNINKLSALIQSKDIIFFLVFIKKIIGSITLHEPN